MKDKLDKQIAELKKLLEEEKAKVKDLEKQVKEQKEQNNKTQLSNMRELSALQRHKVENEKLVKLLQDEKKKLKTA